jgi:hypothetical protein
MTIRRLFLGAGNADDIQNDPKGVTQLLAALAPGVRVTRLIDRDDQTADEIRDLQARNIRVLSRRTIESYLLDDLILEAMCVAYGHPSEVPELLQAKVDALANSVANGGMPDDLKRAAGDIYNAAKRLFPDRKLGSNNRAFMKGCCAPLVPQIEVLYRELRRDIFNE